MGVLRQSCRMILSLFPLSSILLFPVPVVSFCTKQVSFFRNPLLEQKNAIILATAPIATEEQEETIVEPSLNLDNGDTLKNKRTTLCFQAERIFESEPIVSSKNLMDFFHQHKSIILGGRNNQVVECDEETYQKYYETWVEKSSKVSDFAAPGSNALMYHVINSGTEFPGLKITSEMVMSCQIVENKDTLFPELQFILLDSKNVASGSKWMVWIYNQLTGEGGKNNEQNEDENNDKGQNASNALMRISVVSNNPDKEDSDNNNNNDTITFQSVSNLQIDIEFPSIMVKLMPVSKRRAEKMGSDSVANALEKEGKHTLNSFQEAYKTWIISTSDSNN